MSVVLSLCMILSFFPIFKMPLGGSINLGEAVPIIFFSLKYGHKEGVNIGILYGILKIFISFNLPPTQSFLCFFIVILFDYILPYAFLGFSPFFTFKISNVNLSFAIIIFLSGLVKLVSTVFSGIYVWKQYVPSGELIFPFVLLYNLSYILPQSIINLILCFVIDKIFKKSFC